MLLISSLAYAENKEIKVQDKSHRTQEIIVQGEDGYKVYTPNHRLTHIVEYKSNGDTVIYDPNHRVLQIIKK